VRHSLDPDAVLLSYALMCAAALVRRRRGGDFTTEQRAVAVVRSMSSISSNSTTSSSSSSSGSGSGARRSEAVLALLRSASFPFSPELWQLAQDAVHWGGALSEDLQEAARVLQLAQIVQRHRVQGYDLLDPAHATRLVRHIAAQMGHCPGALQDVLQVAAAYSHLDARRVYIDCLQNLALSSGGTTAAAAATTADDQCDTAAAATAAGGSDGSATSAASSLAAALSAHSARVTAVLAQAPVADAWSIAQEVLMFCLRSLEEHELQADSTTAQQQQQQQQYDSEATALQLEAEAEARYATAAALALATFLHAQQQQPGGLAAAAASSQASALCSVRQRVLHLSPAVLLPLLRRLQALQLEFNIYLSMNTLQRRPDCCWAMVKLHLDTHMQSSASSSNSSSATVARNSSSSSMRSRPVTTTIGGATSNSNGSKKGGSTAVHEVGASLLLQKARRLAELLGVKHERVVGYAAHEAAKQGRICAALDLCNGLFKVHKELLYYCTYTNQLLAHCEHVVLISASCQARPQ
jgi:hypothetical protein